jgi:GDP-D-mannose 3',5'-epimerase
MDGRMAEKILVTGAGGFIGGHLVRKLLEYGADVVAVDIKPLGQWQQTSDCSSIVGNLREPSECARLTNGIDTVYHLAADMGGIGYITHAQWQCASSVAMTVNLLSASMGTGVVDFVYSSSACVYPAELQGNATARTLSEGMAEPANPEGAYGWEKLFSEKLCTHAAASGQIRTHIARLFNVYGPHCDWDGGREKAPAALCRKIAMALSASENLIEVWGDGTQRRSFLYIDDCIEALLKLKVARVAGPVNIASTELVTIAKLVHIIGSIAGADIAYRFDTTAPVGVHTRIPDVSQAYDRLGWTPTVCLELGLRAVFDWIYRNVMASRPNRPHPLQITSS